jgi:hypothetical protein
MSMRFDPNDELFRPTLGAEDDAVDFDRPWNPWSLVVLTFFFGLIAGGGLLAFNFQRLGMKGRLYPTLALVAVASLLIVGVQFWLLESGRIVPENRESTRMVRWAGKAVSTLIAIAIAAQQQRRFRLFQVSSLPGGHLLWPALAAIGVSMLFGLIVAGLFFYRTFF